MNRNTVSTLIKESNGLGLIKALPNGYEITDDCFVNPPQKDTAHAVYNEICQFCLTKVEKTVKVTPKKRRKMTPKS